MEVKKSLRIPVSSDDKIVTVELKNDIDFLEILSLKFTQSDVYQSGLCSDYGVVAGRISVNNGYGIPNAKVSIFIPLDDNDEPDPVISSIYPYKHISDTNEEGYRYNLLPSRKQHGGHNPTGSFFDQEDILTSEEYLQVFEKYYKYTVKTNDAGDFMIWGVPIGTQTIHIDIDLSDIGCFSLRPYDFIRNGTSKDNFKRVTEFDTDSNLDGLPQIVKFDKDIEVYPFIGSDELCEIGISRVDFDLSEINIRVEPVALLLVSTITDDNSKSIKRNGKIRSKMGYKCNLQTSEGKIESVRFTGGKVYGSDGILYPELEYFPINETIDENGVAMVAIPMNMDYTYTNEFGEEEITTDKNKGIPTTNISRFRISLNTNDPKTVTAKYLAPNIREFNSDDGYNLDEYNQDLILSYTFSDVFEDYLRVPKSYGEINSKLKNDTNDNLSQKKSLILNYDEETNELIPKDYFYKFAYGKVYTISSFQGSYYDSSTNRNDSFLGIKEIRPNDEDDCAGATNYFPVNFGFRNKSKFSLVISQIILFLTRFYYTAQIIIGEFVGGFLYDLAGDLHGIKIVRWRPFETISENVKNAAYKVQAMFTVIASLKTYPDCDECVDEINFDKFDQYNGCPVAELKLRFGYYAKSKKGYDNDSVFLYLDSSDSLSSSYKNGYNEKSFLNQDEYVNPCDKESLTISGLLNAKNITITVGNQTMPRYYGVLTPYDTVEYPFYYDDLGLPPTIIDLTQDSNIENKIVLDYGSQSLDFIDDGKRNFTYHIEFSRTSWRGIGGQDFDKLIGAMDDINYYHESNTNKQFYILKVYDRLVDSDDEKLSTYEGNDIEQGCEKYDTYYNEDIHYKYLWSNTIVYDSSYEISKDNNNYAISGSTPPPTVYGKPPYEIMADIAGDGTTKELPLYVVFKKIGLRKYERQTISGKSELRDGVFTVIPVIKGKSKNIQVLTEWYKRKQIALTLCSGIINYSFIDNWLNGILYFFKFQKKIKWGDQDKYNFSQRSKYPRKIIFYNILDSNFYYRSTPYNPVSKTFAGQVSGTRKELLHPTTFYDVGVRDEFFYEICTNPKLDPACSVIRDISSTSYQDPGKIVEYGLMYKLDIDIQTDVKSFFSSKEFENYSNIQRLDGDFLQLFSINSEAGIEEFDLDTPQYFMYNNEILDPESYDYFKKPGTTKTFGPLILDFKLDSNGDFIRRCLNYNLGDYSQEVPFYLWNKYGEGFGTYDDATKDKQSWDRTKIASMKLQRIYSISNVTDTSTNYIMNNDEDEKYLLMPMTKDHRVIEFSPKSIVDDIYERFDYIEYYKPTDSVSSSDGRKFIETDLWLMVTNGTVEDPLNGEIFAIVNGQWKSQGLYQKGSHEVFLFETAKNYSGVKQVLSTPFLFYFGLRPHNTSLDLLNKYFGNKGEFLPVDCSTT